MALIVCAPDPEPPDRAPLSSPAGVSGLSLAYLIAAYMVIMHMVMGGVQESTLLQKALLRATTTSHRTQVLALCTSAACSAHSAQHSGMSHGRTCKANPDALHDVCTRHFANHFCDLLVHTGVPSQAGRAAHACFACAPTRGNQRLQPAASASAVARAVRRQLRARRVAVEGQYVIRRHVACA